MTDNEKGVLEEIKEKKSKMTDYEYLHLRILSKILQKINT